MTHSAIQIPDNSFKSQLFVLDQPGYLSWLRTEDSHVLRVVSHQHQRSSIILTSNKLPTEKLAVFDDHAIANAILDRRACHNGAPSMKGDSYQLRPRSQGSE